MEREMKNFGVYQQEENDCGAASFATILKYFGYKIPLYKIKQQLNMEFEGTSIYDLCKVSLNFGLESSALTGTFEELKYGYKCSEIRLPCIAHVVKEEGQSHFIVLFKLEKGMIDAFDPAYGKLRMKESVFREIWTGNIIQYSNIEKIEKENYFLNFLDKISILYEFKKPIIITILLTFLATILTVVGTRIYQNIVDNYILLNTLSDKQSIFTLFLMLLLVLIFQNVLKLGIELILSQTTVKLEKKINAIFFNKFFSHSIKFFQNRRSGDFLTRIQDIENISEYLASTFVKFISSLVMSLVGGIVLFQINKYLFLIAFFSICAYVVISYGMVPVLLRLKRQNIEKRAVQYSDFKEIIDGIETIKVFQAEPFFLKNIKAISNVLLELKQKHFYYVSLFSFFIDKVELLCQFFILALGVLFVLNNTMSFGEFLAFESLLYFFINPTRDLVGIHVETQEFLVSFERLIEYLEEPSYKESKAQDHENTRIVDFSLALEEVSYAYKEESKLIENLTFEILTGEKICLEGGNGSGKTTLVKILAKVISPTSGRITIGNIAYNSLSTSQIHSCVSYSTQNNYVFKGTLEQNLIFDRSLEVAEYSLLQKLENAGVFDQFPTTIDNLGFQIQENGKNLSEGQKQLIGVCRLLINATPIMIFDECISKIDHATKMKVIDFIFDNFAEYTCIFIDHNESLADRDCRRICISE